MASALFSFDAPLEPLPWSRTVYTILRVPQPLAEAAARWPTRRVAGMVDDHPVNVGLNRADVIPDTFIYAGSGFQARIGVRAGDLVSCRLQPVDPDIVPVPEDVRTALVGSGRLDLFEALPPGQRRRLLAPVDNAVKPATRSRRIEALLRGVTA